MMKRLMSFVFIAHACASANAQADITRLDTTLWTVDTISSIALVFPNFEFESDTTLIFVDPSKRTNGRLLTLNYKKGAAFVVGDYTDTYGVQSVYLYLNVRPTDLSRTRLLSLVDTVISYEYGNYYCVSLNSLGLRNDAIRNTITVDFNIQLALLDKKWVILSGNEHSQGNEIPKVCLFRFEMIQGHEPPFERTFNLISIDVSE